MLTVLLLFDVCAVAGVVVLLAARWHDGPLGLVVWMPVGGWVVGYVTAFGIWQTWPGIQSATDEWVAFVTSALLGSLLGAAAGWVLARAYFRGTASQHSPTENLSPDEGTPSNPRRLARTIMLVVILVVVVMECLGCAGLERWLMSYAK